MSGSVEDVPSDHIAEAVRWRRKLHHNPEVAYTEWQTADFVAAKLAEFGLKVHRGLAGTGVVGTLTRGVVRRTIGIRADMDALRIQERTNVAHASSREGVMHACGHDGHVVMALTAARICAEMEDLNGAVHFIFQPAEEGGAGALRMIEEGLFRYFPCDAVYAMHNWPELPLGTCVALDGAMMAANAIFEVEIAGHGCHSAMPHQGTDSLLAGCELVSQLQTIVSRNVDPAESAVVSATQIRAGTEALNVIPDGCCIRGMARWFTSAIGDTLERRITELSGAIAAAFGCKAQVRFIRRTPATINCSTEADFVRAVVRECVPDLRVVHSYPSMGSEDFSYMLQAVPGCYLWLGAAKMENNHGLHSPCYDFNDELLPLGVALWVGLIRKTLAR